MIYFAKLPTGTIKIGYSADLDQRISGLRSHYGCDVEILRTMEGGRQTERELHDRFAHLRIGRTEQFRPGHDLCEFIGLPLLVSANPETVEAQPVNTLSVRLPLDVIRQAKVVASLRGISVIDLMSEILRPLLEDSLQESIEERAKKLGWDCE